MVTGENATSRQKNESFQQPRTHRAYLCAVRICSIVIDRMRSCPHNFAQFAASIPLEYGEGSQFQKGLSVTDSWLGLEPRQRRTRHAVVRIELDGLAVASERARLVAELEVSAPERGMEA